MRYTKEQITDKQIMATVFSTVKRSVGVIDYKVFGPFSASKKDAILIQVKSRRKDPPYRGEHLSNWYALLGDVMEQQLNTSMDKTNLFYEISLSWTHDKPEANIHIFGEKSKKGNAMSNINLRSKIIRLAHEKPELREHLLPLVQKSAAFAKSGSLGEVMEAWYIKLYSSYIKKTHPAEIVRAFANHCTLYYKGGDGKYKVVRIHHEGDDMIIDVKIGSDRKSHKIGDKDKLTIGDIYQTFSSIMEAY